MPRFFLFVYYLFIFIELADYFISLPELYGSGNDDAVLLLLLCYRSLLFTLYIFGKSEIRTTRSKGKNNFCFVLLLYIIKYE